MRELERYSERATVRERERERERLSKLDLLVRLLAIANQTCNVYVPILSYGWSVNEGI